MMQSDKITQKCKYVNACIYSDTDVCIDNVIGCLRMIINKEEAENPLKSRH